MDRVGIASQHVDDFMLEDGPEVILPGVDGEEVIAPGVTGIEVDLVVRVLVMVPGAVVVFVGDGQRICEIPAV